MPYNTVNEKRMAESQSWMQLPISASTDIINSEGDIDNQNTRFAQLVYQVNSTPITLSGDVNVDSVGIDDSGMVKLNGDQLKVSDAKLQSYCAEVVYDKLYAREIQEDLSGNIYIAQALPGTALTASNWRAQKINEAGSRTWADNANFSQKADALSGLIYT
jgi:uncharacterized secreted protein with C-terminal beta-propeller domain